MKKTSVFIVTSLMLLSFMLAACNYPGRQIQPSPTASLPPSSEANATPTPIPPLCANQYFPNNNGDTWEYSGSNSFGGSYTLTNTVIASTPDSFMQQSKLDSGTYTLKFNCSAQGLAVANPIEQYAGSLLSNPGLPVQLKLTSVTGVTLPATIKPGDTWQQAASGTVSYQGVNTEGAIVFNYTAAGLESVTVPFGTFNALRVNVIIKVEVTPLRVQLGTIDLALWLAPNLGLIKSEGTSHIPGVEFTEGMQLTSFTQK